MYVSGVKIMSIAFIHLSDIHFGQEKGGNLYINNDAKDQLLIDVRKVVATLPEGRAAGLIVTGDIAYGGRENTGNKRGHGSAGSTGLKMGQSC
jgi:hypothetical protein